MSTLPALQVEEVSKTVRKLAGGGGAGLGRGRVADARAVEARAKETLEETKRLVSAFNDHMYVLCRWVCGLYVGARAGSMNARVVSLCGCYMHPPATIAP